MVSLCRLLQKLHWRVQKLIFSLIKQKLKLFYIFCYGRLVIFSQKSVYAHGNFKHQNNKPCLCREHLHIFIVVKTQRFICLSIDGLLFQCLELLCVCTYFFAVKTLHFTCLSIKLLCDRNTITTKMYTDTETLV